MFRKFLLILLSVLFLLFASSLWAQYGNADPEANPDSTAKVKIKADSDNPDSVKTDSSANSQKADTEDSLAAPVKSAYEQMYLSDDTIAVPTQDVVDKAHLWLRRMFFRGTLDASHLGAWTRYNLTEWNDRVGSSGSVEARLTISYLGTSTWMGKDAEWLQAVYQTMGSPSVIVDYDILIPKSAKFKEFYRVIYRVNAEGMIPADFNPRTDQPDFESQDIPISVGEESLRLYSGTLKTEKYQGTGPDGTPVIIFKSPEVRPMGIARLGYTGWAMTFAYDGYDAEPRFDAPPPVSKPDVKKP